MNVVVRSGIKQTLQAAHTAALRAVSFSYPFHDQMVTVTHCGRICFRGRKVNLSQALAGQNIGMTQVGERLWLVSFMHNDLGYFDDETYRLQPSENLFGPKVLPM